MYELLLAVLLSHWLLRIEQLLLATFAQRHRLQFDCIAFPTSSHHSLTDTRSHFRTHSHNTLAARAAGCWYSSQPLARSPQHYSFVFVVTRMGGESADTHVEVVDAGPSSDQSDATTSVPVRSPDDHSRLSPPPPPPSSPPPSSTPSAAEPHAGSSDAMALSPEPESPDAAATSSTFSNLRLSPQRRASTPRSSPSRPSTSSKKPRHHKPNATNKQQQQPDEILSLIDPIYLLPSPTSPPVRLDKQEQTGPRVGWDRVVVYRFPLTADASKVPGDSRSYYSVGLDYGAGERREEWRMEEWETRRGKERSKKGCPELSAEERLEVWIGAQDKLKEEAEDTEEKRECSHDQESEADGDSVMQRADTDHGEQAAHAPSSAADTAIVDITAADDTADHPIALHTHNLRKRHPPPSPVLLATQSPPARSPSPPPLFFSDVSDLTFLRSSRARVGCSCTVAAGDRQTKVCTAPWLQQSKRASNRRKDDNNSDDHTTATQQQSIDSSSDDQHNDQHNDDYMAGHDARDVVCECLRAGVGCNSNTCACYAYCCRNPYERYLFNAGKVNSKRRKMLASMKEMREKGVNVVADDEAGSAGRVKGGKGKGGHGKQHGRKRAQSV